MSKIKYSKYKRPLTPLNEAKPLTPAQEGFGKMAGSDGKDFRFTSSNSADKYPMEITNYPEDKENTTDTTVSRDRRFKLEDFQLLNTVGTGTFGRVLLCKDKTSKKHFAMKVMNIGDIIKLKQIEHVKNEKAILSSIKHPFIVNLLWTYHDRTFLYMVLEYVPGGELFSYLRKNHRFDSKTSRFFAAEIVCAFSYLHNRNLIYRDLKPENILLTKEGHVKLTDFGFAKKVEGRTWTVCGTPEYLAPELIQCKGHDKGVDWWSLGILIYEMLTGYPPFYDDLHNQIYAKIIGGKYEFPRNVDSMSRDIIRKLLQSDRHRRLGCMRGGSNDVKQHLWFKGLDWSDVENQLLTPPFTPLVRFSSDTSNYQAVTDFTNDDWYESSAPSSVLEFTFFRDF